MIYAGYEIEALEAMGYTEYPLTDVLEVHFGILRAYSLRGMMFKKDCEKKQSEVLHITDSCAVAIAQSINEASKMLVGDKFVEDERKWSSDKNVNSPFLLIYFREASPRELRGGYRQEKDGKILTYDAFSEGKKEIMEWEDRTIPGIVTSLTVNLSTLERQVDLVPIERSVFGITSKGQILFDIKGTHSVSIYSISPKSLAEINTSLEKSKGLLPVLTKDMCRHFYAALNEPDAMKKFLGYFQFIERYTNSRYKLLSHSSDAQEALNVPSSKKILLQEIVADSKNLSQKFRWCSILDWKEVEDSDAACFQKIKKIRDRLSHGEHIEETDLPVDEAKTLALKLLGTHQA